MTGNAEDGFAPVVVRLEITCPSCGGKNFSAEAGKLIRDGVKTWTMDCAHCEEVFGIRPSESGYESYDFITWLWKTNQKTGIVDTLEEFQSKLEYIDLGAEDENLLLDKLLDPERERVEKTYALLKEFLQNNSEISAEDLASYIKTVS